MPGTRKGSEFRVQNRDGRWGNLGIWGIWGFGDLEIGGLGEFGDLVNLEIWGFGLVARREGVCDLAQYQFRKSATKFEPVRFQIHK